MTNRQQRLIKAAEVAENLIAFGWESYDAIDAALTEFGFHDEESFYIVANIINTI